MPAKFTTRSIADLIGCIPLVCRVLGWWAWRHALEPGAMRWQRLSLSKSELVDELEIQVGWSRELQSKLKVEHDGNEAMARIIELQRQEIAMLRDPRSAKGPLLVPGEKGQERQRAWACCGEMHPFHAMVCRFCNRLRH